MLMRISLTNFLKILIVIGKLIILIFSADKKWRIFPKRSNKSGAVVLTHVKFHFRVLCDQISQLRNKLVGTNNSDILKIVGN